jgi:hypothetical protein
VTTNRFFTLAAGAAVAMALVAGLAAPAAAQPARLSIDLDALAKKASNKVEITLDGLLLDLASRFLSKEDPEDAKVKELLGGVKGIYVHSYEFDRDGQYSDSDVEQVRRQMAAPGWSRLVNVQSYKTRENVAIYIRQEQNRRAGLAILATEPRQFTVVNIVGQVDLSRLSDLEGHLGIPEFDRKPTPKK